MIRHAVDSDNFVSVVLNDAGYVFVEMFFPYRCDDRLPVFYSTHALDVYLGECIRMHDLGIAPMGQKRCGNSFYRHFAPMGQGRWYDGKICNIRRFAGEANRRILRILTSYNLSYKYRLSHRRLRRGNHPALVQGRRGDAGHCL